MWVGRSHFENISFGTPETGKWRYRIYISGIGAASGWKIEDDPFRPLLRCCERRYFVRYVDCIDKICHAGIPDRNTKRLMRNLKVWFLKKSFNLLHMKRTKKHTRHVFRIRYVRQGWIFYWFREIPVCAYNCKKRKGTWNTFRVSPASVVFISRRFFC